MPVKGSKKEYCVRGHKKGEVGTAPNGWCLQCRCESYARRGLAAKAAPDKETIQFRHPYCPANHDKRIVGVNSQYNCRECVRLRGLATDWRSFRRERANRKAGLPGDAAVEQWTELPDLRKTRLKHGYTQHEMAALCNLNRRHYGKLESGEKRASRQTLVRILTALSERDLPPGRHRRILEAVRETGRRGTPTCDRIAELANVTPHQARSALGWLRRWGVLSVDRGQWSVVPAHERRAS